VRLAPLVLVLACGNNHSDGKQPDVPAPAPRPAAPVKLAPVAADALCVTTGKAAIGSAVTVPAMRGVIRDSIGDAAALTFIYRGDTENAKALASGQLRRQVGLKLRARDSCNVVYVMWRLDPKPKLDVSVKLNPSATQHEQCGAGGYTKIKPAKANHVPTLAVGDKRTLRAEISGDELVAWIDDSVAWRGTLPAAARSLTGPAGLRSDNMAFDLVAFSATAGDPGAELPKCAGDDAGGD
jgi:hypothetical protein